ncbi:hypothetical protein FRB99_002491 [Tulasnella sp. 403]|nr:hypothetical protein FRB99_002491 [Tulasnella sp. 403]
MTCTGKFFPSAYTHELGLTIRRPVFTCAAVSAVSLAVGYYVGRSTLPPQPSSSSVAALPASSTSETSEEPAATAVLADNDSDDEGAYDADLSAVSPGLFEECKLILIVRTDLGMTKGKIAAQCGHATLACYKALLKFNPALLRHWELRGQAKVALRCDSEEEMDLLEAAASSLNICARSIRDAGRTQIPSGSKTVLGIGPAPVKLVNQVTGKLKLL